MAILEGVCQLVIDAFEGGLDTYAAGFRVFYPTLRAMVSNQARWTIYCDFICHPFSIDQVERLNSELAMMFPPRAPARAFVHCSRESTINQSMVLHTSKGGDPPLRPKREPGISIKYEKKGGCICQSFFGKA